MHKAVTEINQRFRQQYLPEQLDDTRILEVGSRDVNGTVRDIYDGAEYTGIDIEDGPGVDVVVGQYTWRGIPFDEYDSVICCNVIEHVRNPSWLMGMIISRCKYGGHFLITCPTRLGPHDYPHDYWRVMPDGMRLLADNSGFNVEVLECGTWPRMEHKDTYIIARREA